MNDSLMKSNWHMRNSTIVISCEKRKALPESQRFIHTLIKSYISNNCGNFLQNTTTITLPRYATCKRDILTSVNIGLMQNKVVSK